MSLGEAVIEGFSVAIKEVLANGRATQEGKGGHSFVFRSRTAELDIMSRKEVASTSVADVAEVVKKFLGDWTLLGCFKDACKALRVIFRVADLGGGQDSVPGVFGAWKSVSKGLSHLRFCPGYGE